MKKSNSLSAFKFAFPLTLPVLAGFIFLGISYGVYARVSGLEFYYPILMSIVIFGGSLEFVTVSLLLGSFAPFHALLMAIMVQARHLFYAVSMLDKYGSAGKKKFYLIFAMCDESFSINYSANIPENTDKNLVMLFVSILNQFYWVVGASLGAVLGGFINFSTEGLDFVMTAMFVVIFLEQWLKEKRHVSSLLGLGASVICLLIFGAESFLIPTMVCILLFLTVLRKPIEKGGGAQ